MPPRAGGAQGGEGGGGASSWVFCGVGATVWASPQTAVAALGGVGSASGGIAPPPNIRYICMQQLADPLSFALILKASLLLLAESYLAM